MSQQKLPEAGLANGTVRQPKPVFRITTVEAPEYIPWSMEECMNLVKGMQQHGLNWEIVGPLVATKSKEQVEAQGQRLMDKIEKIFGNAIEFIKNRPPEALIDYLDNMKRGEERKSDARNVPIQSEEVDRKEPSEEFIENAPSKKPSPQPAKAKKAKKKKVKEEPQDPPEPPVLNEEVKIHQEIPQPFPQILPQVMMPYQIPNIISQLYEIKNELGLVSGNLNAEKPNCKSLLDTDAQFKYYWDALEKCSSSLQNIVSDIYYIHVNSQPVQQQMIPAQFYYPQDQLRPRFIGPPFHQERPPGNEFQ
eukprot:TRINITY_DN1203_c0_g1_i12.p1 TRINITY_DN1203_c0_g1~~TRINITY_DN1203_c0_g1_i12.p1  ORF type:complete len:306 (+),score=94.79 TRINITY_DN1203_c0_g1_i12:184-1101(+)